MAELDELPPDLIDDFAAKATWNLTDSSRQLVDVLDRQLALLRRPRLSSGDLTYLLSKCVVETLAWGLLL